MENLLCLLLVLIQHCLLLSYIDKGGKYIKTVKTCIIGWWFRIRMAAGVPILI